MEKNEIIGKLSSYFKLSGSEAENIYKEIFDDKGIVKTLSAGSNSIFGTGYTSIWNSDSTGEEPPIKDENQLELEYETFSEHRSKISKEVEQEEEEKITIGVKPSKNEAPGPDISIPLNTAVSETESPVSVKSEEVSTDEATHPAKDNSYYIWYKDAESDEAETETLSYEYELMYQAAKESEYQSKMKIYAASFVFFFSFVLLMLILSPLIYKQYFASEDLQRLGESLMESKPNNEAVPNDLKNLPVQQDIAAFPSLSQAGEDETDAGSERSKILQNETQNDNIVIVPQNLSEQETSPNEPVDMTKISNGWADNRYNVLYIKLDNGKYTVQESSWDSYEKAEKRKAEIESLNIPGLKGTVEQTTLEGKGNWYRVRFGEFGTVEEARQKVEAFLRL